MGKEKLAEGEVPSVIEIVQDIMNRKKPEQKSEKKSAPVEKDDEEYDKIMVVPELPTQPVRYMIDNEKKKIKFVTITEALTQLLN